VEPIFVRGGPTALAALISGDVDFASVGGAQAPIRSRAKGLDVHIIASLSNYTNYTLLGSKETKSVEDLRGKIIGVTGAGAFSDFAIRIYLKRTTWILTKTPSFAPSAEPRCAPSHWRKV
jgi:ABC-type nitrate/sulfonate/bicarbonate transport system substrate-binding protein